MENIYILHKNCFSLLVNYISRSIGYSHTESGFADVDKSNSRRFKPSLAPSHFVFISSSDTDEFERYTLLEPNRRESHLYPHILTLYFNYW